MSHEIRINVYRSGDEWFASRWVDGTYDGCDALCCDDDADEATALACAREMPLHVQGMRTVQRVEDVS